ncbi:SdrD B-like domain-containing protein [Lentzea sp. NPDC004782]|uniref:SdrD B-like domain-containing protein n=1 Tax=Lentzea sp. NPDC004782 TaxID=3154458 RepID=UPI0033A501B2
MRVNAKNDSDPYDGSPEVEVPLVEPKKLGKISGVLWGDANGNGVQDPGEGLAGAQAYLYGGGDPNVAPKTRTDANGRFTFTDLETRTWGLSFNELPGGWVRQYSNEYLLVDGSDSTSELRYQAVRPLTDQLTASVRWLSTEHVDGGQGTVEFTLTNKGGADIKGVVAGCDRAGEGPHLGIDDNLGELRWDRGATIPAGQSRVFTVTGTVPRNASEYGWVFVVCDFGPADGIIDGFPSVFDFVKVGSGTADTYGSIYVDRNGNGWQDSEGEHLTGVSFSLVDPKTGQVVATATGEGENGWAHFNNIPKGLYTVKVNGPYTVKSKWYVSTRMPGWAVEVVPVDAPGGAQPQPQPQPEKIAPVVHKADTGLALTGVNVTGLGAFGVLALLVGGASVFFGRRRTA